MAESLFNIFGDHHNRHAVKNVTRQPFSNIENMGKTIITGPLKPNEPVRPLKKDGEPKKSFMANTGKALQCSTPAPASRKVFTPRATNVSSVIYSDDHGSFRMEEVEFTRPIYKYDHNMDIFDLLLPSKLASDVSPPSTPPPTPRRHSEEMNSSYQDEFFTDDFSLDSLADDDLGLPALY